jgi:polyhydroxybutyrate depolymerase
MTPGDYKQKITSGGVVRPYLLHIPTGYDGSSALPLVFVLHGAGGNAASMVKATGMNGKADQQNFFVAYLNGTGDRPGWNTGITPNLGITVDDVAFIRELLADLEQQVYVDSSRVYVAGFSNGAFMGNRLAAELSDLLAAVAVVEGTIGIKQDDGTWNTIPEPHGPMPIIIINGEKDPVVIYNGGPGKGGDNFESMSVADAVAFWTKADGCSGTPVQESSAIVSMEDYQTCADGSEVLLYSTVNGVHE